MPPRRARTVYRVASGILYNLRVHYGVAGLVSLIDPAVPFAVLLKVVPKHARHAAHLKRQNDQHRSRCSHLLPSSLYVRVPTCGSLVALKIVVPLKALLMAGLYDEGSCRSCIICSFHKNTSDLTHFTHG